MIIQIRFTEELSRSERCTCPSVFKLIPSLPLLAAVQNPATSEVASYSKPAFLVQFEMFVFPCSFCSPLTWPWG